MAMEGTERSSTSWVAAALAPWCDFLKRHTSVALKPSDHHGLLIYVRLRPPSSGSLPDQQIVQVREAMTLLGAVAAVDNTEWQELLEHQCACANLPLVTPGVLPPRFEVRLGDSKDDALGFDTNFYRTFFFSSSSSAEYHGSKEFTEAMQMIHSRVRKETRGGGQLHSFSTIGKCMVHVQFIPRRALEPQFVSGYLASVLELMRDIRKKQQPHHPGVAAKGTTAIHASQTVFSLFVLESVRLHIGRLALPAGASAILAQIVELDDDQRGEGVQLYPWIDIGANTAIGQLPATEMAHLLQVMTSKNSSSCGSDAANSKKCRVLGHPEAPATQNRVHINNFYRHLSKISSRTYLQKVQALCSSIATSQRVNELHVDSLVFGAMETKKLECWQWLAYALFSKDSASSVSKLVIEDKNFRERDVEAIVGVLRSKNPAATLWRSWKEGEDEGNEDLGDDEDVKEQEHVDEYQIFGVRMLNGIDEEYGELDFRDSEEENADGGEEDLDEAFEDEEQLEDEQDKQDPVSVCLKAGAAIQICSLSERESEPITLLLGHKGAQFRVMNNDETCDYLDIAVPCYGHCRVQRESITQFVTASSQTSSSSSLSLGYKGSITSLSLDFQHPADGNVLLPLIKYLGPHLTALDMRSEVGVNASCFRKVMNACPNLKTLAIPDILSIAEQELIAAYEEQRCKISDLCIFDFAPSENTTSLIRLLCGATSAAAQTIRHLKLIPEPTRAFEESTLSAVLEMLQVNSVLESLQLRIPSALYATFAPELMKFHGQSLPVTKTPLSLPSRLAFLSVVQILSNTSTSTISKPKSEVSQPTRKKPRLTARNVDFQSLDSDVISLIFRFTAERPTREIDIQSL